MVQKSQTPRRSKGNSKGIVVDIGLLSNSLRYLHRDVATFWAINRERNGLELCKKYMEMVPFGVLHVVRNGYYGFQLYENSKHKTAVEKQGKSLYFHELNDMVCNIIRNNNIPAADAVSDKECFGLGVRTVLARRRERYSQMLGEVIS